MALKQPPPDTKNINSHTKANAARAAAMSDAGSSSSDTGVDDMADIPEGKQRALSHAESVELFLRLLKIALAIIYNFFHHV